MRVPLLDLKEQYRELAGPIRARIEKILSDQRFILGPNVAEFETAMATFLGSPYAIGVSSGTDALLAALMALEIGPGDAVIVPAYSFFATAGCVARVGATPVFVDIAPETFNLSAATLAKWVEQHCERIDGELITETRDPNGRNRLRVRAIIPVHLFGLSCDMEAVTALARQYRLTIIEDAAQAIGAEFRMGDGTVRKAGTIGEIGCFSFYPSKNLGAAGDAGLMVCREAALADRLRIFRQHGMNPRYYHHVVGGNFRLDEIQAAILSVKLPHLDRWAEGRRRAADTYRAEFGRAGLTNKILLPAEPYRELGLANHHVYHQFVVRTPDRDDLRRHLDQRGIGTEVYYPLGLHEQKCFAYLGNQPGDFPETERAARESLALPIWPEISPEAQQYVVQGIADFFANH